MKLTGINPVMLRNLIERGSFTEAPPGQRGVPRYFARDDLVALVILKVLLDLKFQPSYAAKIASEIRRKMRKKRKHRGALPCRRHQSEGRAPPEGS